MRPKSNYDFPNICYKVVNWSIEDLYIDISLLLIRQKVHSATFKEKSLIQIASRVLKIIKMRIHQSMANKIIL